MRIGWIVDDIDSIFFKESSAGSLLNIFLSIYYVGDIWSDLTKFWGPTVGILTKNSSEKSKAPNMPGVPLWVNIIINFIGSTHLFGIGNYDCFY